MVKKQGGKIACGQCHKFFKEDELILDEKNERYLCDGCYEPRDHDPEPSDPEEIDDEHCEECGNLKDDCECNKNIDVEIDKDVRAKRGEERIKRDARGERARPIKEKNKKSLISW
jgi:hypothetical protein